ncbi:MAG TPA: metalloregulator ArsR/SmtB family transcription factor [Candidatus Dojkabacteria bacterium]|mgnify:CR=1 FL=1|nr:metalloregulator ArsR/SmtB family transcription factor [Candidatus Dojkabacteria bacterium]HRO65544.1 metalloregulator ArsR/SmtB family transcription factor [Candidatus Dojkabacteria bacterium]HRP36584.1 metalloregulator ArsR/SmtB family transcription factor [Candidatus Dojkabacteria bacterium]HRP51695.1 metalloregulator ArsR/SmtB family transcription factor [Candidatus Dojkabacteria bacterium]
MSEIILKKTSILKILADPSRYKILELLINSNGKLCVGDIAEQSKNSPSAVSHQLAKLESAGLISPSRNGQQICYRLESNEQVDIVLKIMKTLSTKNLYSIN